MFELALVLVRSEHVARRIVNPNMASCEWLKNLAYSIALTIASAHGVRQMRDLGP